jgi:hypothetical protein
MELGNAPAHKLFDLVSDKNKNQDRPARTFSDYDVVIDKDAVPSGVELMGRLYPTRSSTLTSFSSRSPRSILTRSVS